MGHNEEYTDGKIKPLSETELAVVEDFLEGGITMRTAYKKYFPVEPRWKTYKFFQRSAVRSMLKEYEDSLDGYNTTADNVIIRVMTDGSASNRDKLAAAKQWNERQGRVVEKKEVSHDFTKLTDEQLDELIGKMMDEEG